jgi:hypothetical protein
MQIFTWASRAEFACCVHVPGGLGVGQPSRRLIIPPRAASPGSAASSWSVFTRDFAIARVMAGLDTTIRAA